MGEPLEQYSEQYLPNFERPTLQVIEGLGFGALHKSAEKHARKFWGIEVDNPHLRVEPTVDHKLIILRDVLKKAPGLGTNHDQYYSGPDNSDLAPWAYKTAAGTFRKIGKKVLDEQKVVLQRKKKNQEHISKTTQELMQDQEVRMEALLELKSKNDPVIEVISAIDSHRFENSYYPYESDLHLGYRSFDLFLLSIRKEEMKNLLGQIAKNKLQLSK